MGVAGIKESGGFGGDFGRELEEKSQRRIIFIFLLVI